MSLAVPLKAYGVPVINVPRQSTSASSGSNAIVNLTRLLSRLEEQVDELDVRRNALDSWQSNSIPIALTHANSSLAGIQADRGITVEVAELRSRLQKVTQRYVSMQADIERQTAGNVKPRLVGPVATRSYLTSGMSDDSEADSEFEDNEEEVRRVLQALQATSDPKVREKQLNTGKAADDEFDEYEEAASIRRRKGGNVVSGEESNEKSEITSPPPPTALQSERSIQDSLAAELLRMAGVLKTNSVRFADALKNDRKVVEQADEKLQGNLTLMKKTRGRLGDYSRKARGMGWMTLGAVAMVCMSWVVMFMLIRLT
jgi:hypothetical protein